MTKRIIISEKEFLVAFSNAEQTEGTVNGKQFELNLTRLSENRLHVIRQAKSYEIEFLPNAEGSRQIRVNGNIYSIEVKGKFDDLLKKLGMQNGSAGKVSLVKAPMPGLVLQIAVKVGNTVKKGDRLLLLEAMKMENVIKSPTDGTIASIEIEEGKTVDKNEVMVRFE